MGQVESFLIGKQSEQSKEQEATINKSNSIVDEHREVEDSDNESKFKKILHHFSLVAHNHKDEYFGDVEIFRCNHNKNFRIVLREIFTKSEAELVEQIEMWTRRMQQLRQPNLIQLHACCHSKVESFCASFFKVFLIFDSVETDLLSQIRKERIQGFSEDELWYMLDSLIGVLEFMQEHELSHQALRIDTIYITINHKNVKLFKLADAQLMGYITNYHLQLDKPEKYIYLSPLLYKQFGNTIENPIHDEYKSDVFTLGLLFIHLALFESCTDLYMQSDFSINQKELDVKLEKLKQIYSSEFVTIIAEMVKIEENQRPDFRALDRQLSSIPKLFGRRICEMVEVPDLYKMKPHSYMSEWQIQQKKEDEIKRKTMKESKEQEQKQLSEKDLLLKAIQSQDALNIIKESLAKTSYLTEQVFRQSQRTDIQFSVDNALHPKNQHSKFGQTNLFQLPENQINFVAEQMQALITENPLPQNSKSSQLPYHDVFSEKLNYQTQQEQIPHIQYKNFDIPFTNHQPINSHQNKTPSSQKNQQLNFIDENQELERLNDNANIREQDQMITSASKNFYSENPELSKIILKNLVRQTRRYGNGEIYEGDLLDGKRHGFGVYIFSNSQKYVGQWENNNRHGKGTQYSSNGQIKYEGQWQDDLQNGFGILNNKESVVSQYQLNPIIANTPYQDLSALNESWKKYEGDFKNGLKDGFGTITYSNKDQFIGPFRNGEANGVGSYMSAANSTFVSGEWKNNILIKQY